jgi:GntR family transcriptional regulator/MocR family aminotransferase
MSRKPATGTPQWEQLFQLPVQPGMPLQARLRLAVVQAILDNRLSPGTALPSSRELATLLGMSRNTVTAAYQQLVDDGYLDSRLRQGVFVSNNARPVSVDAVATLDDPFRNHPAETGHQPNWSQRVLRSLGGRPTLAKPARWRDYPYPFVYGACDPKLFPVEDFRECCTLSLSRVQVPQWTPDLETDDVASLIEQIRLRLLPQRGVFARAEEILITVGAQHAYYLLAEALFDPQTRVGLEEPGHPHARNSFSVRGPQLVNLPVDTDGLVVDGMPEVDYVFVTPSHQSPTTHVMALERRQWLLRKAELHDFVVIEDDYEADTLYEGNPMPALKSLDKAGRVIYIGSLSKSLSPALRLGYIVAEPAFIQELRLLRHAMLRHPSALLQHTYAMFLSLGHHESHARRVNQEMLQRLTLVGASLQQHLPDFRFTLPRGGASLWVEAPEGMDSDALAAMARQHGVLIEAGAVFFAQPPVPCPYFRLRLSSIPMQQIEAGVAALARAVRQLRAQTSTIRLVA